MNVTQEQQRNWNLNFFKSKVKEHNFYLREVVKYSDQSMQRFRAGQQSTEQDSHKIVFAFSAFANTIQTLKDCASGFLPTKITWSDIANMHYGEFMWLSRNAATHDGHPIVTAWADGHYFIPADIYRLGSRGELIKITAPTEDVCHLCLEFSRDFCDFLAHKVQALGPAKGMGFCIDELEQAFSHSNNIPEFARQLFQSEKSNIAKAIAEVQFDPRNDALISLQQVLEFCNEHLETRKMN